MSVTEAAIAKTYPSRLAARLAHTVGGDHNTSCNCPASSRATLPSIPQHLAHAVWSDVIAGSVVQHAWLLQLGATNSSSNSSRPHVPYTDMTCLVSATCAWMLLSTLTSFLGLTRTTG